MEIRVLHLYPDLLDLYGDSGNIATLRYRCESRGIKFIYTTKSLGDEVNFCDYDLIFVGGGADFEQKIVSQDLLTKKSSIKEAIDKGVFFLLICGGYQLFGEKYISSQGDEIQGLGIFDYYTENSPKRMTGNILIEVDMLGDRFQVIGFENHAGNTKGVTHPFGKVIVGHGNEFTENKQSIRFEGFYKNNVLGTYLHGPLLPKNPKLTDHIIMATLKLTDLQPLDDSLENLAFSSMVESIQK